MAPGGNARFPLIPYQMSEFEKLVFDMRKAQKEYFRTRTSDALEWSKRLERQVDEYLKDKQEPKLFR